MLLYLLPALQGFRSLESWLAQFPRFSMVFQMVFCMALAVSHCSDTTCTIQLLDFFAWFLGIWVQWTGIFGARKVLYLVLHCRITGILWHILSSNWR
jgi:hypothetical protein